MTEGVDGLLRDKSRPPGTAPLDRELVDQVVPKQEVTYWTVRAMAKAVGIAAPSVVKIWYEHGLAPHRWRSIKLSNDKAFTEKLHDVVGLYVSPPAGAIVLSADEKSQIQALDRKTVCPLLAVTWLALHCASEDCSGGPSRSSSQEDEPCQIIGKHLSESMSQSLGNAIAIAMPAGREQFASSARPTPRMRACAELSSGSPTGSIASISATRPARPAMVSIG